MVACRRRVAERGGSAVEALLALPVVLLLGLGTLQLGLLYHARLALHHALHEAARAGSTDHASPQSLRRGLARGVVPWLYGASDAADLERNVARAAARIALGEAAGWIQLQQLSPTDASFADWAEPALDPDGRPMPELREIPNDNLAVRARRTLPAGGAAGERAGEPIGAASGQTLADANLLQLRLIWGAPLSVPLAGRAIAAIVRRVVGCGGPAGLSCVMYGDDGTPRLPVRVVVTLRMQSPARHPATAVGVLPVAEGPGAGVGERLGQLDEAIGPVSVSPSALTPVLAPASASAPPTSRRTTEAPRAAPAAATAPTGAAAPADAAFCTAPAG